VRRLLLLTILTVGLAAVPAGEAAAQDACAPPAVDAFLIRPDQPLRAGRVETITVSTVNATGVSVAWPDGSTTTAPLDDTDATFRHTFRRTGEQRIVATATGPCGPPGSGALTRTVRPPCSRARDRSVLVLDCDAERGIVAIAQDGLTADANWLDAPCNDVLYPPVPVEPEPVARAAACAAPPPGPPPVDGRLPVRSGTLLALRLGVPADRVLLALGGPSRPRTAFRRAARAGGSGRFWRIRLATVETSSRLWIRVRRGGGTDHYVAGLRAR
jgi:hypothetical protein